MEKTTMTAFLYTWNPKKWHWSDQQDAIYRVNNNKLYDMEWSCGNRKHIEIGDLFFLVRLGVESKGIIGCGYITSEPYLLPHWDEVKASKGKQALRTDLLFKALSEQPIISLESLQNNYPAYDWTPRSGGVLISETIAFELFSSIQQNKKFDFLPATQDKIRLYSEGKVKEVTLKTYDRSAAARQICIEHHGYNCAVCSFNFADVYGALGTNYIEVHHLKQLADIGEEYQIDPIKDLRPVCANCHRMLHKERPPLSIEELQIKTQN
jgi:5-methylcytosine-specific restriction protein A